MVSRPIEVDSDQSETLIKNNQGYTTQEIADILKISKSIKLKICIARSPATLQWDFHPPQQQQKEKQATQQESTN